MDLSNKKRKNLTYWINLTLYIVFGLLVIGIALYEGLCLNVAVDSSNIAETIVDLTEGSVDVDLDVSTSISSVSDRFYINNLAIIICPLLDSIIGISFSAYKDKIYGFTISDLKDMSHYSGFSFVEIVTTSVISIALCLMCFYFDLFYTTITINSIILIFTFIYIFCDISLLSRAKFRIRCIFRYTYKCNKKRANEEYIADLMRMIKYSLNALFKTPPSNFEFNGNLEESISDYINVFQKEVSSSENPNYKKFGNVLLSLSKYLNVITFENFNDTISSFLEKTIRKTFDDEKTVLAFSDEQKSSLADLYAKFLEGLYKSFYSIKGNHYDYNVGSFFRGEMYKHNYTESYQLDFNCRLIIANMVIKDGIYSAMDILQMSGPRDVEACIDCQKLFLNDVINCDKEYLALYLTQAQNNIKDLLNPDSSISEFVSPHIDKYSSFLGSSISEAILNLKETADICENKNEGNINIQSIVEKCLPLNDYNLKKQSESTKKYQQLRYYISSYLLIYSLKSDSIWVCDVYNKIYSSSYPYYDVVFYVFFSIYLFNKHKSGEFNQSLADQIDSFIKPCVSVSLTDILFLMPYVGELDQTDNFIVKLFDIIDKPYPDLNFSQSLGDYNHSSGDNNFSDLYIARWIILFLCCHYPLLTYENFQTLRNELSCKKGRGNYTYWDAFEFSFCHIYSETIDAPDNKLMETLGYFEYYSQFDFSNKSKEQYNNSLRCLASHWLRSAREYSLSTNLTEKSNLDETADKLSEYILNDAFIFELLSDKTKINLSFKITFDEALFLFNMGDTTSSCLYEEKDYTSTYVEIVFNKIIKYISENFPQKIHYFERYTDADFDSLSKSNFDNKIINTSFLDVDFLDARDISQRLGGRPYLLPDVHAPYDIFFNDGAIKVSFYFKKNPVLNNISSGDAIKIIDERHNKSFRSDDNKYNIKLNNVKHDDLALIFSKDELIQIYLNRFAWLDFELACDVEIDADNILIYKRDN